MRFLKRLLVREQKSAYSDSAFAALLGGGASTPAGGRVSPETAMRVPAVRGCVAAIAETLAGLPLVLYRRLPDGGKERAADHPLYILLHDAPSDLASSFEFRREMQADLLLHGRAFAFIGRTGGTIIELLQLEPQLVAIDRATDGEPSYRVTDPQGGQRSYGRDAILHLEALGGHSPVMLAREAIGLALLLEEHGARLFAAGAKPGGVLETDKALTPTVIERLKASFEGGFAGSTNSGRTAILEDGLKFKPLTLTSTDAQYLELRKFQNAEIARAFRVPLHKIGELDRATFSNIEHQSIEFVTDCIMPWLKLWEGAIRRSLLTEEERGEYFAEFLGDDLMRGDIKSRYEAYSQAILNGVLSPNEVRARENLPPYDGGDQHRLPLNTEFAAASQPA